MRGVGVRGVVSAVRAHDGHVGGHRRHRRVPGGAVVQPGLPRVHDAGQPAPADVPAGGEVALLGHQPGIEPAQRRPPGRRRDTAGTPSQAAGACTGGWISPEVAAGRCALGERRVPELGPREVRADAQRRVEHDVRHPPVDPLGPEQARQLPPGAVGADVGPADRDERRVPAPLVRVEGARGHRVVVLPVGVEGGDGEPAQGGRRPGLRRSAVPAGGPSAVPVLTPPPAVAARAAARWRPGAGRVRGRRAAGTPAPASPGSRAPAGCAPAPASRGARRRAGAGWSR